MDRALAKYHLARYRKVRLSPQCEAVSEIFWSSGPDPDKLARIVSFLENHGEIEEDTAGYLARGIRGHYGGEGYVLSISSTDELAFWQTLHTLFPSHSYLSFVTADAAYCAAKEEYALALFLEAFGQKPDLVFQLGGEVVESFRSSKWKLEYEQILFEDTLCNDSEEEIEEHYRELLLDFEGNRSALEAIKQQREKRRGHSDPPTRSGSPGG